MESMASKVQMLLTMSMNTEDTAMAYREDSSRCPPSSRQPRMNRGILRMMTTVPMGAQGRMALMIWPTPVMPPKAMSLGT